MKKVRLSNCFDFFSHQISASIFGYRFFLVFSDFGWILAPVLDVFWHNCPYFLYAFFLHRFCREFRPIFHDFLDAQNHVFYCKTNSFEHFSLFQKSMNFHRFWHPFWHHFGSRLPSIFNIFLHRFLHAFFDAFFRILVENGRQMGSKDSGCDPPLTPKKLSKNEVEKKTITYQLSILQNQ